MIFLLDFLRIFMACDQFLKNHFDKERFQIFSRFPSLCKITSLLNSFPVSGIVLPILKNIGKHKI